MPWWLLGPVVLLAFRGALVARELLLTLALKLRGCPGAGFDLRLGRGGMRAVGLETCAPDQIVGPALVGVFGGVLLATGLLVAFTRGWRPRSPALTAFIYLFALATAAEVLSGSVVFSVLERYEPAVLGAAGVSRFLLIAVGVLVGLVWWALGTRSSSTLVWALGRPESQTEHFRRLVAFKLTAGAAVISLVRIIS